MERTTLISPADVEKQLEYCRLAAGLTSQWPEKPLAFVDTYGCQQNEADSERIRGYLEQMGFGFTDREEDARIIVINTCAIREHAEQRVFGNVGALVHVKRRHPDTLICLCGCMVQQPHAVKKLRESYRHVDLVFGPHALWRFPEMVHTLLTRRGRMFLTPDEPGSIAEGIPVVRQDKLRAWASIMYGCNNFCSYCIVPYVRGRERSRRPEDVLAEVRQLADHRDALGDGAGLVLNGEPPPPVGEQGVNHLRELPQGVGAEDQIHVAVGLPDFLGGLGLLHHAPAQADELFRVAALHVDQGASVAQHPLLGVLPDGAGVDDDDPGLLLVLGEAEAHLFQIAPEALGVRLVLLAAVGVHKGQGPLRPLGGELGHRLAVGELGLDVLLGDDGSRAFHKFLRMPTDGHFRFSIILFFHEKYKGAGAVSESLFHISRCAGWAWIFCRSRQIFAGGLSPGKKI